MATDRLLVGVMLDVSGSMRNVLNLRDQAEKANVTRIRKLLQVVSNVAHRAARPDDQIAVTAFGTEFTLTCDLLQLLKQAHNLWSERKKIAATEDDIEEMFCILEKNGASLVRDWVEKRQLVDCVRERKICHAEMEHVCRTFKGNAVHQFIKGLPRAVRDVQARLPWTEIRFGLPIADQLNWLLNKCATRTRDATGYQGARASRDDILRHIQRAVALACNSNASGGVIDASDLEKIMLQLPKTKPWHFREATNLFRSLQSLSEGDNKNASAQPTGEEDDLNTSAVVNLIEPCIYAGTPMCKALQDMASIFQNADSDNRILFILSDGDSADGDPHQLAEDLKQRGVTIVSCLLIDEEIPNPRQLFDSNENPGATNASRTMYDMSSSVSNGTVAMRMLAQQGWNISTTGESRLFVQANHSVVIDEFVGLVGRLLCSNDVLVDIVARVPLDLYVQDCRLSAPKQEGGTCYANAVGAVYHMAMTRIYAREGGVPDFEQIRNHIIVDHGFGYDGANTVKVLEKVSSDYRLHSKEVDETGAREALNRGHPVVATYALKESQWSEFRNFFAKSPTGVLDVQDISSPGSGDLVGHAVVFIGYDRNSLRFMNSWGKRFANNGFFKIRSAQVLSPNQQPMRFFDVFWYESELTDSERTTYREYGADELKKLAKRFNEALQILDYKCPECGEISRLNDFQGNIFHAFCPQCKNEFTPRSVREEFLTNIYLRQL